MDDLLNTALADPQKSAAFIARWGRPIADKIKELVTKVGSKKARVQPDARFERGEAIGKSELFAEYAQYTKNEEKRAIIRVGLIMRELPPASPELEERRASLRAKGESALHLAELVQSDVLKHMLRELRGQDMPPSDFQRVAADVIENVDHYVEFIQTHAEEEVAITSAVNKIRRAYPRIFVILAGGYAIKNAEKIAKKVRDSIPVTYTGWYQNLGRYRDAFIFLYDPKGAKLGELQKERDAAKRTKPTRKKASTKRK